MGLFNAPNVFVYAASSERWFERQLAEVGYERKTTFFHDLSIADWYGIPSIKDTYRRVMRSWIDDIQFITEFYMCLNWKIWQLRETYPELAKVYQDLWDKSYTEITKHYKGNEDALSYFYRTTD